MLLGAAVLTFLALAGLGSATAKSSNEEKNVQSIPLNEQIFHAQAQLESLNEIWNRAKGPKKLALLQQATELLVVASKGVFDSVLEGYSAILDSHLHDARKVGDHLDSLHALTGIDNLPTQKWDEILKQEPEIAAEQFEKYLEYQIAYRQSRKVLRKYAQIFKSPPASPRDDGTFLEHRHEMITLWRETVQFTLQSAEITAIAAVITHHPDFFTSAPLFLKIIGRLQASLQKVSEMIDTFSGTLESFVTSLPMISRLFGNLIEERLLFDVKAITMIRRVRGIPSALFAPLSKYVASDLQGLAKQVYEKLGHFALVKAPYAIKLLNEKILMEKSLIPLSNGRLREVKSRLAKVIDLAGLPERLQRGVRASPDVILALCNKLESIDHGWSAWGTIMSDLGDAQLAIKGRQCTDIAGFQARKAALAALERGIHLALEKVSQLPASSLRNSLHQRLLSGGYLVPLICVKLRVMGILEGPKEPMDFSTLYIEPTPMGLERGNLEAVGKKVIPSSS